MAPAARRMLVKRVDEKSQASPSIVRARSETAMALIQFVQNYDDLSTDRGHQFKFYCDRCGNGHMSRFKPSVVGTAGSLLRAAGDLFGGVLGSAGHSAYEIQIGRASCRERV
jgi:hypothetical protein